MKKFTANLPFSTPAALLIPTEQYFKGVLKKTYPETGEQIYTSFRTFGGTETTSNGQTVVENTGIVQTWYRPDITASCRLVIGGVPYEILGTPENINMMNQYLQFKVRAVKGGA